MSHVLLVTRPDYDEATTYLFHWCKPVINMAMNKGYKVVDIIGNKVNKNDFESRVKKIKPNLIFFNGHGSETEILGQDGETLINANDKMDILRNTIIYSRSCNSGKILGKNCIDKGITSFIGYTEPFIFVYTPSLSTKPLNDKIAALFLNPSNKIITTLLKGHSSIEADKRSKNHFRRNIQKLLTSETSKENTSTIRFLFWDMKHQVCLGDQGAILE